MARNSPKQYAAHLAAQGRPAPKPRPAMRLRHHAAKLRLKAQSILAQASELDEIANELDGIGAKEGQ
jgi:hypothetical protein